MSIPDTELLYRDCAALIEDRLLIYHGEDKPQVRAGVLRRTCQLLRVGDQLLHLAERYASECGECGGEGVVEGVEPVDNLTPAKLVACPACADIRQVIATAKGGRT